jgi:integrase
MPRITKRSVDAALPNPAGGDTFFWDSDVKGFGLRMKPSGVKSYVLKYRIGRRTRRLTIGKHGSPWTPEQARERAGELLRAVYDGRDPATEKAEARRDLTITELSDVYLDDGPAAKPNKKPSSWITDRSNIERHIKPLLGQKMLKSLTQAEVAKFQADVAAGKNTTDVRTKKRGRARVRGGKGTAARSLAVLGAMLEFGLGRGLIPANPARGVPLLKGEKKERFLSGPELTRLADTITSMERGGIVSSTAATAVRLLLLTGCRKTEILSLEWDWIDTERRCLRLPDSKTGAKVVPLAMAAMELLNGVSREPDAVFVLPAATGRSHYVGLQKDWERIRARADLNGLRLHDLRHSFASFAVAGGHSLFLVGKVLGHKQARTTEGYAHLTADPVLAVADTTAARIVEAMGGIAGRTPT